MQQIIYQISVEFLFTGCVGLLVYCLKGELMVSYGSLSRNVTHMHIPGLFFFLPSKWHAENKIVDVLDNNTVSCDEVLIFKKAWLITWGEQVGVRSGIYSLSFC